MIELEKQAPFKGDIQCPNCNTEYNINWDNDSNQPEIGDHDVSCLACNYNIYIVVTFNYSVFWG